MPGLSSERIPNNPLTGPELKVFCLSLLEKALANEWVFNAGTSYPRVGLEITAKFHFLSPSLPKTEVRARITPPVEPAPLLEIGDQDSGVIALKIEKTVENPNLERVHAGMPIQIVSKAGAQPGEMLPRIETHAVIYDKEGYPEPEPPKQTDISEETAKTWGVRTWRPPPELRLTAADEALAAVVPISREEELDAISTEEES